MKKLTILMIMALCTVFCFTACEGTTETSSIYSENDSGGIIVDIPDDPDGKIANLLYETYKNSVENAKSENGYDVKYTLLDIDSNGIPELIYNTDEGKYNIYTFNGTDLKHCGKFNSKMGVFTHDGSLLATTGKDTYMLYVKVALNENLEIYDIGYPYLTSETTSGKYTFENKEVDKSVYDEIKGNMKEVQMYSITDSTMLDKIS